MPLTGASGPHWMVSLSRHFLEVANVLDPRHQSVVWPDPAQTSLVTFRWLDGLAPHLSNVPVEWGAARR